MRYLLIDGNHLAGRCRATLGEMTTSKGLFSGVVFGFLKGLNWVHYDLKIDYPEIIVCWDYGRAQFRLDLYPEYKAGRTPSEPTPEQEFELKSYFHQLNELRRILESLGCKQIRVQGVEADDLIGIYSKWFENRGHQVLVYSGDKDMHQLVSDNVSILDPKKGIRKKAEILAAWEVERPEDIVSIRSMTGDVSDNISGIRDIGEVRARIVLNTWKAHPTLGIPGKNYRWVKKALENKDIINRNLKLMALPRSWEESRFSSDQAIEATTQLLASGRGRNEDDFISYCRQWELQSILDTLNRW